MQGELILEFEFQRHISEIYPIITGSDSPLKHRARITEESYLLEHRSICLNQPITLGPSDPEIKNGRTYRKARNKLGLIECISHHNATLSQEWDYSDPNALTAYREIIHFIKSKNLNTLLLVDWELGDFIAGGFNLEKGIYLPNERQDILPL